MTETTPATPASAGTAKNGSLSPLVSTLYATVIHRAGALSKALDDLPLPRDVGAASHSSAVMQVKAIAAAIIAEAERTSDRAPNEAAAMGGLRPLLQYLSEVIDSADMLFARGRGDVPTSLLRAVQRELDDLGVKNFAPLLCVGAPANYETESKDLWEALFQAETISASRPSDADPVRVFTVPPLEGVRALWTPVTVGHEVAHVVDKERNLVANLDPASWLTLDDIEPANYDEATRDWPSTAEDILRTCQQILVRWASEVACDLYAVRRFGPAGVAAQCDFLASVAAEQDPSPSTHPPAAFRAEMMLAEFAAYAPEAAPEAGTADGPVAEEKAAAFAPILRSWRAWAAGNAFSEDVAQYDPILQALRSHRADLVAALDTLPTERYDLVERNDAVVELVEWLRSGIAGREHAAGRDVEPADVLNAGWIIRTTGQLPGGITPDSLETLDNLVAKSLDTGDFVRLWRETESAPDAVERAADGVAAVTAAEADSAATEGAAGTGAGGVITSVELRRRLAIGRDDPAVDTIENAQRLIVTPEETLHVAGASVDLRLGRQFIVFRRSSTAAFSALANQRPREMQEFIEKDWGGEFVLHPGELVLAASLEYLRVPADLTAQVITRSSYGRLGLLSATAVQVQPEFTGCLTLELVNLGQMPLALTPGERVAQLVFTRASPAAHDATEKYQFPTGPQFSRVTGDEELPRLRKMRTLRTETGR